MIKLRFLLSLLVICASASASDTKKPLVISTTSIIYDAVLNIAGDKVEMHSLVPVGSDPHLYDPIPADAQWISNADLIITNGLKLEGWLNKLINNSGNKGQVLVASNGVIPIGSENFKGSVDPHAWMSVKNMVIYVNNIHQALVELMPHESEYFDQKTKTYLETLHQLEEEITKLILEIPPSKRVLITTHDAFEYYSQAYQIEVFAALGISTEADVRVEDLKMLSDLILERDIPTIFAESTINPKLFEQLAMDLKIHLGPALYSDSLGDLESGADTYVKMMLFNTRQIVKGLKASPAEKSEDAIHLSFLIIVGGLLTIAFLWVANTLQKSAKLPIQKSNNAIEIKGLSTSYDKKTVLRNVYLNIETGNIYGIIGPNGAGKSTLFKSILGLIPSDAGSIEVLGSSTQISQAITYIPQKDEIDWTFPAIVEDIVLMGRYPFRKTFQKLNKTDKLEAELAMKKVDIYDIRKKQIGELSGGQQQRVFIARALCQNSPILLLDEPFVGVDITTEAKILDLLHQICAEGKTVLVIHHDISKAQEYFDKVILLNQRIIAVGDASEVMTDDNIRKTYSSQLTMQQKTDSYLHK